MIEEYKLKDNDGLIFTGKQLREWKQKIIEEFANEVIRKIEEIFGKDEEKYYTGKGCDEMYTSIGGTKIKCGTKRDGDILLCSRCYYNQFYNRKFEDKKSNKLIIWIKSKAGEKTN